MGIRRQLQRTGRNRVGLFLGLQRRTPPITANGNPQKIPPGPKTVRLRMEDEIHGGGDGAAPDLPVDRHARFLVAAVSAGDLRGGGNRQPFHIFSHPRMVPRSRV
mmetsp:Transcript_34494/g.39903  ORF Transcript_34494/g.39903 Transcript_34494/m.39903 type:complete len:105 (-) Transcript_34494:1029-1343(-)